MEWYKKGLYTVGVLTTLALGGCGYINGKAQKTLTPNADPTAPVQRYEFSSFGEIADISSSWDSSLPVASSDLDGDGDMDIIIGGGTSVKKVIILENKIPQKGLENQIAPHK